MEVTRRAVLILGTGALLSGCTSRPSSAGGGATRAPDTPSPTKSAAPVLALPQVTAWHPDPADNAPACKAAAVRRVERAGNGPNRALQVIDAQYGGLLNDSASVLVVTRSWSRADHAITAGGHTFDVRLSRRGSTWLVTQVHPSQPGSPSAVLSRAARAVLASERITLPPAGRADVRSGRVHDSALHAMLAMSATFRIGVSVVRSRHPLFVFGTDRLSDHPQGRAFDTWEIDGHAVVDRRTPRSLVEDYMHAAAAAGSYNVGGPYALGAPPQWFTDATHHDHVHAGFTA